MIFERDVAEWRSFWSGRRVRDLLPIDAIIPTPPVGMIRAVVDSQVQSLESAVFVEVDDSPAADEELRILVIEGLLSYSPSLADNAPSISESIRLRYQNRSFAPIEVVARVEIDGSCSARYALSGHFTDSDQTESEDERYESESSSATLQRGCSLLVASLLDQGEPGLLIRGVHAHVG